MGRIRGYYEWDDDRLTPGRKRTVPGEIYSRTGVSLPNPTQSA